MSLVVSFLMSIVKDGGSIRALFSRCLQLLIPPFVHLLEGIDLTSTNATLTHFSVCNTLRSEHGTSILLRKGNLLLPILRSVETVDYDLLWRFWAASTMLTSCQYPFPLSRNSTPTLSFNNISTRILHLFEKARSRFCSTLSCSLLLPHILFHRSRNSS